MKYKTLHGRYLQNGKPPQLTNVFYELALHFHAELQSEQPTYANPISVKRSLQQIGEEEISACPGYSGFRFHP